MKLFDPFYLSIIYFRVLVIEVRHSFAFAWSEVCRAQMMLRRRRKELEARRINVLSKGV
jgi:hypothetical protein